MPRPLALLPAIVTVLLAVVTPATRGAAATSGWAGTWAASVQPFMPGTLETYDDQTLRLIVHSSVAGSEVRITLSNVYGTVPLTISDAHIAIRTAGANVQPRSDRALLFVAQPKVTIAAHSQVTSDPVHLEVPALTDLAISFFLPHKVDARTSHLLALQTSYVAEGNAAGAANFQSIKTIDVWPFLTGVDVRGPAPLAAVAVIGSSTTDGDGSTQDQNRRLPDALARRFQKAGGALARIGVLNAGIIGNRLLKDSPAEVNSQLKGSTVSHYWNPHAKAAGGGSAESPFGAGLGEAALTRLDRDALDQPGVQFLIVAIGVNDIAFPGSFTPPDEAVSAQSLIQGYREIIERAHRKSARVLMTTIPPFGNAIYPEDKTLVIHTPEKETVRREVNEWIRTTSEADGLADFDAVLRDPTNPDRLLERFDSGDHLHANDAGYAASAEAIPLGFFASRAN
jgi:lysophospholipase L1-like esterase